MNYEALGRYHALKNQRALLLAEIRAASTLFAQLQQQAAHTPRSIASLADTLEQATAIVPRLRLAVQQAGELSAEMDKLQAQYNLQP